MKKLSNFAVVFVSAIALTFAFIATPSLAMTALSSQGMVVAMNFDAAKVGAEILEKGGNAFDAAIAVSLALGVVEPYGSGLGGEGYIVARTADGNRFALDFRSVAPRMATYGSIEKSGLSFAEAMQTLKGVGVFSLPAALEYIHQKAATMPMEALAEPAIHLAQDGFAVNKQFAQAVTLEYEKLLRSAQGFLKESILPWEEGDWYSNPSLAETLRIFGREGAKAFYNGSIADSIEFFMKKNGGWLRKEDFQNYRVIEKVPLHGTYRGYDIYVSDMPAGGPRLIETLNILEKFNMSAFDWDDPLRIHIMQEVFILTALDQEKYVGDRDFSSLPKQALTDKKYAERRFMEINLSKASLPQSWKKRYGNPLPFEENQGFTDVLLQEIDTTSTRAKSIEKEEAFSVESPTTTHFAVMDKDGNVVSCTQTISDFFGTGYWINGFFLNNELNNFSGDATYGAPLYLEGGKRPRTTIAPLIIEKDGKVAWVLGTPGGGRIVSTLVQIIVDLIDFDMSLEDAVKSPKFVGYVLYPELRMEKGFSTKTVDCLQNFFGHVVKVYEYPDMFFGGLNMIEVQENGSIKGVGSFRRSGSAVAPEN
ncbi:MAG: gamma-glutamyltransferase [Aminobacterium sp.]|uniref:gamma-glutamyltransferase n=1 Tax=unclassified Aminobacterium TaxID=2685012 RepID=UPI001BCA9599|nr:MULTISPECIES: gamma-glutamyltransferase [unclassified Aminobacterium]MEA4877989.1 gamma-glutamyltransferase [Aminobacterium sp.]WMI71580.1 gamma-glutamyltransferase [Aminobacterium sp. MB27-C1]